MQTQAASHAINLHLAMFLCVLARATLVCNGMSHESWSSNTLQGQVQQSSDPEGLRVFYYLVQDLKCLVFSIVAAHFKIQPITK